MEFDVTLGRIRFNNSLSRILAKKGSKLIGRKDEVESGGLWAWGPERMLRYFL